MRARHEYQIRLHDDRAGETFDRALNRVISRHGGLAFFADDQIAEIRAEMIQREWASHQIVRRARKLRAA